MLELKRFVLFLLVVSSFVFAGFVLATMLDLAVFHRQDSVFLIVMKCVYAFSVAGCVLHTTQVAVIDKLQKRWLDGR